MTSMQPPQLRPVTARSGPNQPHDTRTRAEMHLGGAAVEARDAVCPQPVVQVGVVACPEKGFGIDPGELGIEMRDDRDLIISADHRQDAADRRIDGSARAALMAAARSRGVAPTVRVVGYSTGTNPVTSVSRRIACSCTAGNAPAAANDGDKIAMRSPGWALGGWTRSCAMRVIESEASSGFRQPDVARRGLKGQRGSARRDPNAA
jgi:hypothetical protein